MGRLTKSKVLREGHVRTNCGRQGHGSTQQEGEEGCPAFNKKCDNFGKVGPGHSKKKCLSKKNNGKPKSTAVIEVDEAEVKLVSLLPNCKLWRVR